MRRAIGLATAIALLGVLVVASPASAARRCEEPEPALSYEPDRVKLTLRVNYRGCGWWHGDSIALEGELTQGPLVGAGEFAFSECATIWASSGNSEQFEPPPTYRCSITLGFDHPPAEAATYAGYFEYPWKGGTEHMDFEYTCLSAAVTTRCLDNQ